VRDALTIELEWLTRGVRAVRIARQIRNREMSRLDDKFAKAGGVVQRVEQKIEDRLDALIARETEIVQKTERVFDRHMAPVDNADKALDAFESKLDLLSNGGPHGPLPGSGSSQEVDIPKPPAPQPEVPPEVLKTISIALQPPEPQTVPQDPARAIAR
jgi:hypothetical protein